MSRLAFCLLCIVMLAAARGHKRQHISMREKNPLDESKLRTLSRDELIDLVLQQQHGHAHVKTSDPTEIYWWKFTQMDCGYDDVAGSCEGKSIDGCKQQCLQTQGCGGFNYPHGVLKKTDCLSHMAASTVDLYVIENSPQPPPPAPTVNFPPIWPYPSNFRNGSATLSVKTLGFNITATTTNADLNRAIDRFMRLFFPHTTPVLPAEPALPGVTVTVTDLNVPLQLEADESYNLLIPADGTSAMITAPTIYGAYHALETLAQLIMFNFDTKTYYIPFAPWSINDTPRFAHREVLIDSSRHFLPVWTIHALLESLTYAKINVVHWHLVDSQSFPFDSPSNPNLGRRGSYSPQERYTAEDVADVVEHARRLGIRVMVEIDTPGHAASWCAGYPEVCPSASCLQPLNPATNATFDLIDRLFTDLTGGRRGAGLFFDNMMHLGGDEVDTSCWTSTAAVSQWMKTNGFSADQTYMYFVQRVQAIAHKMGRDVVGWEEIWDHFGTRLDKSTIIHQWLPGSTIVQKATAADYRVLWSTDGVWYMDGLGTTWKTMYVQEPCNNVANDLCDKLVLGGGGEMWGETVDTSDIQQTIWPRLAAIAERLWSPRTLRDADAAQARYSTFRCYLNRRGVAAAPSNNAVARTAPPGPGGCYSQ